MAILAFQKPDKVIMLEGTDTVGRFEFRPLEPGYEQTIGNALRRILLSSLEGFAITSIKISGVDQEFATIPGVIEGMQDIILNLKQVRFKRMVETVDSETANIVISGKQEFTAEDISKGLSSFKVLNPELHICSLEPGYGQTIGNALRRILLSSLEGFAITSIKISGVDQEFATIPGVIEGMQDIILNLKQVRFKRMVETVDSEVANIVISGKQEFTAEDISKGLSSFKVLNPELHICSLEPAVKLEITLSVSKGRGFVPADENRDPEAVIGTIPVDAIYTPIKNVNWTVENWRVEQKTDYEKLNLEIVTDGSITPNVALQEAANILIYHFKLFTDDKKLSLESSIEAESKELDEESLHMRHLLLTKLSDMGLSVRAYNCLKAADIDTFADLVSYSRAELMKFRNFGRKSLNEIDLLVEKMKLSFGMDVTKFNIEPKKKNV